MALVQVVGRWRRFTAPALGHLLVLGALAVTCLLAAAGTYSDAYNLRHGAVSSGTVSDVKDDGSVTVTFVDGETSGNAVSCDTTDVKGDPLVNSRVLVYYDPQDPEGTCAIGDAGQSYVKSIVLAAFGVALSAGFVVVLLARRRRFRVPELEGVWIEGW